MRRGIATLQRLRDLRERQALAVLAEADRAARSAAEGLDAERSRHAVEIGRVDATSPGGLMAARLRGTASLELVHRAAEHVADAEATRDDRAEVRTQAAIAKRSLDRLVERIHEREAAEAARREQTAADELATQRWEGR